MPDPKAVTGWQRQSVRVRHTRRLLRRQRDGRRWDALDRYAPLAASLYRAIADVTGAKVVVDSSKRPSDAALLPLLEGVDPYFIHLVRDPRAVAFSWRGQKRELDQGL